MEHTLHGYKVLFKDRVELKPEAEMINLESMPEKSTLIGVFENYKVFVAPKSFEVQLEWNSAVNYCANLEVEKTMGWSLPTKDELNFLFQNKNNMPSGEELVSSPYWSSTQSTSIYAWVQHFYYGSPYIFKKLYAAYVRPIRREKIDA